MQIPLGYWAFIPAIGNDPFAAMIGQLEDVDRVLSYAVAHNMHVVLDLHS